MNEQRHTFPENFHVIQSFGGQKDTYIDKRFPHSAVFTSHTEIAAAGYTDGIESEIPARTIVTNIVLKFHGPHMTDDGNRKAEKVVWLFVFSTVI